MSGQQNQQVDPSVSTTAFVRNIPYTATAKDLGDFFNQQFGDIKDVRILQERYYGKPYSRGIGFVEFKTAESLQKALSAQNVEFKAPNDSQARRLVILQARPKKQHNTAFVKGIPAGTKDEDLINAFQSVKPVQAKIVRPDNDRFLGFAFVKFASPEDLNNALQNNRNINLGQNQSRVFFARTNLDEQGRGGRRFRGRRRFGRRRAPKNNNNNNQPAPQ